ncbi:MAG: glycosyltransferase family 4 protein [Caldilineaceae bacterium]|nr:glycosyltransferase family 4 protein [Caldilineaceae bacterium]
MRITYVLLSPTYGMHLYTADLAADMLRIGHTVHLVTTATAPLHCYPPAVDVSTPVTTNGTGFAPEGLNPVSVREVYRAVVAGRPDVVHVTGVHLWNISLLDLLHRRNILVVHTLHDLDPHMGVRFARLIRFWNRLVLHRADHILVHGCCYRERLVQAGVDPNRVSFLPLVHSFLGYEKAETLRQALPSVAYEPLILFFGRLLPYKGLPNLLLAVEQQIWSDGPSGEVILAGPGELGKIWPGLLPYGVSVRDHLIDDTEGDELFSRAALLVLPYVDASQSALIAAAYAYAKPVIVTNSGALAEYVTPKETGWVVPVNDETALANVLTEALNNREQLTVMGLAGRRRYEKERAAQPQLLQGIYQGLLRTQADLPKVATVGQKLMDEPIHQRNWSR